VPFVFWGGEFAALLVPGADPSPDPANPNTFPLLGVHVHGNLFFSGCMMVLSLLGYLLLIAREAHALVSARRRRSRRSC